MKGDEIACPFHDWRWGGDGRCKRVPYSKRAPKLARTATWTTLEQDGMLFVWNDPEGNPPPPEVTIPRIEGARSDEWTDWHWYTTVVNTNCREIIDNVVDMAHFFYIHGSLPTYFKNIFEGQVATQYMNSGPRGDIPDPEGQPQMLGTTSAASYFGPSFMIDDLTYHFEHEDQKTVLLNCHYPIDANSFVLQYGIIVKKSERLPEEAAMQTAIALGDWVKIGFEQDVAIWKNKARIDNPLLCEEDGPVYQLRRWYQQFYVDVADVAADMVDRFEYEIDVTRPREAWQQQVEENIAARIGQNLAGMTIGTDNRFARRAVAAGASAAAAGRRCWLARAVGSRPVCNGPPKRQRMCLARGDRPRRSRTLRRAYSWHVLRYATRSTKPSNGRIFRSSTN